MLFYTNNDQCFAAAFSWSVESWYYLHHLKKKKKKSVDTPNVFLFILKCLLGYHPRPKTNSLLCKRISISLLGYIQNEDDIFLTFLGFFQLLDWKKTIFFSPLQTALFPWINQEALPYFYQIIKPLINFKLISSISALLCVCPSSSVKT